jgi:hypothetical protein
MGHPGFGVVDWRARRMRGFFAKLRRTDERLVAREGLEVVDEVAEGG